MRWGLPLAALALAAIPVATPDVKAVEPCVGMFDATFLQISSDQRNFDEARWTRELTTVRDLGVKLVIIQYTGDAHGPYDRDGRAPVASLVAAAERLDLTVMIGLWDDPLWPREHELRHMAPPLGDPVAMVALADICRRSSACVGWYISQEIDEQTWRPRERTAALRAYLARTTQHLRALTPDKQIAIAPFFVGVLEPADFAHWWLDVLVPGAVDILILQDGVGTGRATPERAAQYLLATRLALCSRGVHVWAVAELFHQQHGSPIDRRAFSAVPVDPVTLRHTLAIEAVTVERIVAFAVLPYMDPRRGSEARRLHDAYAACRAAAGAGRPSC